MPLAIVATPGADDANSFADVATAEEYASYRVGGAAFLALTADQQIQALVTATRDISTLEDDPGFLGERTDEVQALPWPRTGTDYDDDELPGRLVEATIELAMSYSAAITAGSDPVNAAPDNGNIQEETVGPITTKFFEAGTTSATAFERFPAAVQRLLTTLIVQPVDANAWGSGTAARGS